MPNYKHLLLRSKKSLLLWGLSEKIENEMEKPRETSGEGDTQVELQGNMEETGQEKYEMGILCDDDDHMILFFDINYIIIYIYIYVHTHDV